MFDVFIAHAFEDKAEVASPLARALREAGLSVWYDDFILRVGDHLRRKIQEGLGQSRFGVVILSDRFFAKRWPQEELDALAGREMAEGRALILPVRHGVTPAEITRHSPLLGGRYSISTDLGTRKVANHIMDRVGAASAVPALTRAVAGAVSHSVRASSLVSVPRRTTALADNVTCPDCGGESPYLQWRVCCPWCGLEQAGCG